MPTWPFRPCASVGAEGSFNSVRQIALAIGLKMKKRLTNSQSRFELREEYYFFKQNLSSDLKIIRSFARVDRNVYKTTNKSASIHTYQIPLSSNRHDLSRVFLTRLKLRTIRWNCIFKSASFSTDNGPWHQDSFFYRINFLTIKSSSQNISIALPLTDSALTSRTSRRPYWRKKAPVNDFVRTVPGAKKHSCKWWR